MSKFVTPDDLNIGDIITIHSFCEIRVDKETNMPKIGDMLGLARLQSYATAMGLPLKIVSINFPYIAVLGSSLDSRISVLDIRGINLIKVNDDYAKSVCPHFFNDYVPPPAPKPFNIFDSLLPKNVNNDPNDRPKDI